MIYKYTKINLGIEKFGIINLGCFPRVLVIMTTAAIAAVSSILLLSFVSPAEATAACMPYFPTRLALYDDFESGSTTSYNLADGELSPNGKWINVFNGYGSSGVITTNVSSNNSGTDNDGNHNHVFFAKPQPPTTATGNASDTHAALVLTTQEYQDFELQLDVRTIEQLRQQQQQKQQNSNPNSTAMAAANPWEVAWVMWRYVDPWHHYYFMVKPNGIELGKKDNNNQTEEQVFLYTADYPKLNFSGGNNSSSDWDTWRIKMVGNHIQVYVNGEKVADVRDEEMSSTLSKAGAIGLYTEDAHVQFDNVYIGRIDEKNRQ